MKLIKRAWNLFVAVFIGSLVLTVALTAFDAVWGWARFKQDFWPLDRSYIGPNLCASVVLVVLLVAHNEFVTERRAAGRHESHRQMFREEMSEIMHPTEEAEAVIAAEVEAQFKHDVLDRLDPTTPGGIAAIPDMLKK
jgi:hypothetical protein